MLGMITGTPITDGDLLFEAAANGNIIQHSGGHDIELDPETWMKFRKTSLTRAARIPGPFRVKTTESESEPFFCEDGYLAVDARGYPYAIAAVEFNRIYEPVFAGGTAQPHPATQELLRFFEYDHLPAELQAVSRPFHDLAYAMVERGLEGAELTVGLRKLLEAKDCIVRAAL
jgi:hypothetical protein